MTILPRKVYVQNAGCCAPKQIRLHCCLKPLVVTIYEYTEERQDSKCHCCCCSDGVQVRLDGSGLQHLYQRADHTAQVQVHVVRHVVRV